MRNITWLRRPPTPKEPPDRQDRSAEVGVRSVAGSAEVSELDSIVCNDVGHPLRNTSLNEPEIGNPSRAGAGRRSKVHLQIYRLSKVRRVLGILSFVKFRDRPSMINKIRCLALLAGLLTMGSAHATLWDIVDVPRLQQWILRLPVSRIFGRQSDVGSKCR